MPKINSYDELKKAIELKELIENQVYNRLGTTPYDVYIDVFGIPSCKQCGIELSKKQFKGLKHGFKDCCCSKCVFLFKYGVTNPSQLESVKQKKKDGWLEKYGVDNPAHLESVKQKKKSTNLEKYGVEFYSQSPEHNIKVKETSITKYGVEHFTQSTEYKETRASKIHFSQLNITNFSDYNQSFIEANFIENNKFKMYDAMQYFNVSSTIIHRRFNIPKRISIPEGELHNIIPNSILNNREFIAPLEIDLLSHDNKFCVEYNGLMWHSSGNTTKFPTEYRENYHLIKTEMVQEKGYQLFHIFENEWLDKTKREIWCSLLKNKMNLIDEINLNDSIIKNITNEKIKDFMLNSSLDAYNQAEINLGLYLDEELYSVISFNRISDKEYRIINTCTKINSSINILLNRMLIFFHNEYKPSTIFYRANRRYYCEYLDFDIINFDEPEYFYFKSNQNILYNSEQCKLIELNDYNDKLSETQNMYNNNYRKIYDAGYVNFKKEYKTKDKNANK